MFKVIVYLLIVLLLMLLLILIVAITRMLSAVLDKLVEPVGQ